ncbi:MAG: DUF1699 family protein [Fermentimonas sp.]
MRIRVVGSPNVIPELNANETKVHMTFRPSSRDIFQLVDFCPKLELIQMPKSYCVTLSKSIKMFLDMQKIEVVVGDVWGHRTDIDVYAELPDEEKKEN